MKQILGVNPEELPRYEDFIVNSKNQFDKESRLTVLRIINSLKVMVEKQIKAIKDQRLNN